MVDSGWKRLHFHNQESSWTMVDTGTFDNGTAEHLLLYIYTNGTTNQGEPHIRFNGSGENDSYGNGKYSYRVNSDLEASDAGADAQNWLSMKGDQYGGWTMIKMHIIAKKGHNKLIWWNNTRTHGNTGGDDGQGVGQWVNITENITSIQIKEENGDTMNAGLNILVLGADDGTSTVAEKDKSAITDVPVGTRYEETDTRKIFRAYETDATPYFEDNFDSTSGWSNSGKITVDSGVANKVYYNGVPDNETGNHATRALGVTLSDTEWIAQIEWDSLTPESGGDGTNPLFCLFAAGTTTAVKSANQDFIGIAVHTASNNPWGGGISVCHKDGSSSYVSGSGDQITISASTKYYIRLERTGSTGARLSVYSDSFGGTHVSGSPETYTIPSTIGSLNSLIFVDSQTGGGGGETYITADNLKVWNGTSGGVPEVLAWKEKGTA